MIVGDHLYAINEPGNLLCLELKTGREVWNEKIPHKIWSSLVLSDGKFHVSPSVSTT